MKLDRQKIKAKYNNKCAYCGCELSNKFHVDHIFAKNKGGSDNISNYNPSCISCNLRKSDLSIEEFRYELLDDLRKLDAYNSKYRLLKRYGLIVECREDVVFYFENYNKVKKNCVGYGEFEYKCKNKIEKIRQDGREPSDYWCERCDNLRRIKVRQELQNIRNEL